MNLKIGDKIYFSKFNSLIGWETIKKITPTMYKTESYKLKVSGDWIRVCGSDTWTPTAQLATPELDEKWRKQKIKSWFHSYQFSEEEMIKVYELLNPKV